MRPAAETGPAHLHSPPVVFLLARRTEAWRAPESPGHLLLTCSPLEAPEGATHSPRPLAPLATLPCLSLRPYPPLPPLSPATKRSSSPPLAVATPTGHPTPHRRPRKLRLASLFILTQTKGTGSPWMPLAPPFPSSATEDRRRKFAVAEAPPSSPTPPFDPL